MLLLILEGAGHSSLAGFEMLAASVLNVSMTQSIGLHTHICCHNFASSQFAR